jgi:UDP-N-acetylglucosamine--N-acetylmuramyl-(pentapeptide) pyrophosphoryl-undecaprenol N-acetylglucosamine transferase
VNILVIGGSQGASILSRTVPVALAALPDNLRTRLAVAHQARDADHAEVVAAYAGAGIDASVQAFFDDVPRRLVDAQLVISRSGASSVADIAVVGRPSILIPLAIAMRDEQTANARGLVEAGGAVMIPEAALTPERLTGEVSAVLGDSARAAEMARAALSVGRANAAAMLADLVEMLAGAPPD